MATSPPRLQHPPSSAMLNATPVRSITPDHLPLEPEPEIDVEAHLAALRVARMRRRQQAYGINRSIPEQPMDKLANRMSRHSIRKPQHDRKEIYRRNLTRPNPHASSYPCRGPSNPTAGDEPVPMEVDARLEVDPAHLVPSLEMVCYYEPQIRSAPVSSGSSSSTSSETHREAEDAPAEPRIAAQPRLDVDVGYGNVTPTIDVDVDEGYCDEADDFAWLQNTSDSSLRALGAYRVNGLLRFQGSSPSDLTRGVPNVVRSVPRMRKRKEKKRESRSRATSSATGEATTRPFSLTAHNLALSATKTT